MAYLASSVGSLAVGAAFVCAFNLRIPRLDRWGLRGAAWVEGWGGGLLVAGLVVCGYGFGVSTR